MTKEAPRTYPTLDLLRLVAIGMTILAHVSSIRDTVPILREFRWGMWLGVDLFMLISGWLLGGQLLRESQHGQRSPWRFYFKRWMRTLPPYYVMLVILFVGGAGGMERASFGEFLLSFLFIQQYAGVNYFFVSWSLCVEEHFYLLLPLLIYVIRRAGNAAFVVGLVIAIELVAVAGRVVAYPEDTGGIPYVTHLRWHGLFLGLLFAYLAQTHARIWALLGRMAPWLGLAGIAGTLIVMASISAPLNRWMFIGVPTVGTWTFALLFIPCVHPASSWSRFSFPGLRYLGELTYSLYLVHAVIPQAWLGAKVTESPIIGLGTRLGLMLGCAMALHHVIERPALWLRAAILRRWDGRAPLAPVNPVTDAAPAPR